MDLILTRHTFKEEGIFGDLSDNLFFSVFAVTLEHAYEDFGTSMTSYLPKIPAGVYTCERYKSPKHGYDVFRLLDVPGSDYDEIHIGNYNSDSDGCILIGSRIISPDDPVAITGSKIAFTKFMLLQVGIDRFTLTVRDS